MKKVIIISIIAVGLVFGSLLESPAYKTANKWKEHKTAHFIVYYKKTPLTFVKTVSKEAEDSYKSITRSLGFTRTSGWTWNKRAKIYIYDDTESYQKEGGQAGWSHGSASVKEKIIKTFPSAHGFFDSILPHELAHIIFREFIGLQAQIPPWMEEGVAMYQEKAQRWGAHDDVKKAIKDGTFLPLQVLSQTRLTHGTKQEVVNLFYAESASIINYMMTELGKHRFVSLCRKLREGKSFNEALRGVYVRFKNEEELNKAWVKFLKK